MDLTHNKFLINLKNIVLATKEEEENECWNISGILNKNSNQHLKFDIRPMFNMPNNQLGKKGTTSSKADKIVFETISDWIIVDAEELHEYIKENKITVVLFEDLLNNLDWNIIISKK
jgi:hypothetical protein